MARRVTGILSRQKGAKGMVSQLFQDQKTDKKLRPSRSARVVGIRDIARKKTKVGRIIGIRDRAMKKMKRVM